MNLRPLDPQCRFRHSWASAAVPSIQFTGHFRTSANSPERRKIGCRCYPRCYPLWLHRITRTCDAEGPYNTISSGSWPTRLATISPLRPHGDWCGRRRRPRRARTAPRLSRSLDDQRSAPRLRVDPQSGRRPPELSHSTGVGHRMHWHRPLIVVGRDQPTIAAGGQLKIVCSPVDFAPRFGVSRQDIVDLTPVAPVPRPLSVPPHSPRRQVQRRVVRPPGTDRPMRAASGRSSAGSGLAKAQRDGHLVASGRCAAGQIGQCPGDSKRCNIADLSHLP